MIINKIIINNFFRYYGEQVIEYTHKDNKNVIVLIGENGRGKTTLLSAFSWALYGEVKEPLKIEHMLNENKVRTLKASETATASVAIEYINNNKVYIVERSQKFKKLESGDMATVGYGSVRFLEKKTNGDLKEFSKGSFDIESIIPKCLSGFFFFDGERIDRLAKIDGKKEIRQAILDLLGIDIIKTGNKDLERVEKELKTELKKYSTSEGTNELKQSHDTYSNDLEAKEKDLIRFNKKIDEKKVIIVQAIEELKNCNVDIVKGWAREKEGKEKNLEVAKNNLEAKENEIKKHISEKFKYHLIKKHNKFVDDFLDDRREKGQLPSDIKHTFIEDLLEKKRCICGCELEAGTEGYQNINKLKAVAGRSELDKAYHEIKILIDNATNELGNGFFEKLNKLKLERGNLKSNIADLENEISKIDNKIQNIEIDNVTEIEERRIKADNEKAQYIKKIAINTPLVKALKENIKIIEKKLAEANKNNKAFQLVDSKLQKLGKLISLNTEFKSFFTKLVREELDMKIKEVFAKITNKEYRVPTLNENFELKITSSLDKSQKESVLSTGEGQITSLAFIGALVSYAKENKDNEVLSKLCGDEYPIVMDSPFGNLDHIHTKNVAKNIGELASQVIIIVSQKQWKGNVAKNIESRVSDKYLMRDGMINTRNKGEYTVIERDER